MIEKKHNYVYKITNLLNNKIYIGVHSTDNINDGYMGSGTAITNAIKKYGVENFKKEILLDFETAEIAYRLEKMLVDEKFIKRKDTYNAIVGGIGGWSHANTAEIQARSIEHRRGLKRSPETCKRISDSLRGKKLSEATRKKMSESRKGRVSPMKGKKHSESTKQKISDKVKFALSKIPQEQKLKYQKRERDEFGRFKKKGTQK